MTEAKTARDPQYLKLLEKYRIAPDKPEEFIYQTASFLLMKTTRFPIDVDAYLLILGETEITVLELELLLVEAERRADIEARKRTATYMFKVDDDILRELQKLGHERRSNP